jgi:hypothetical protein
MTDTDVLFRHYDPNDWLFDRTGSTLFIDDQAYATSDRFSPAFGSYTAVLYWRTGYFGFHP